jgi:Tryptophan/tyrosine permease family
MCSLPGSIGMLGSISIAVNSITGPAMVNLPATFARSGIIPTITTLCLVCVLSALCSLHMANSISKVPGNATFKNEVEFSEAFRVFWGQKWFLVTQVLFLCCITCLNISSIVDTSQVVDTIAGNWWPGGTAAIQIVCPDDCTEMYVRWLRWDAFECTKQELFDGLCMPFTNIDDDNSILVTAGNILTTALFLPLALMDLKENSWWQILGFFILLLTSLQFIIQFTMAGLHPSYLSWWGTDWDDLLGVVLFNFALVVAVPAWLYEREPDVDVPTVIHTSSIMAVVMYICIGLLGSMALPNVSDNMLESMMSGSLGTTMQLGASLFAFAIIGLGIPLFSVLTRLNLTGSGLCSHRTGNILAVYFPFAAAWLLSDGAAITKLLSWGGIVFTSLVAFILPLILALHVVHEVDSEGSISVYGGWLTEKGPHLMSVRVLLTIAVVAIFVAIVGNLVDLG